MPTPPKPSAGTTASVGALVDHLFRRQSGRLIATLTRIFGPAHMDLAEEVVQEALIAALKTWPFAGVPDNPAAWLRTVARHRALDAIRRDARLGQLRGEIETHFAVLTLDGAANSGKAGPTLDNEPSDDQLRLMFTCCYPAIPPEARVALTLKAVCGFGTAEIARAFLISEPTVAQRLVRAKRRIRDAGIAYEVPGGQALTARLDAVLDVIYLMFNEGYLRHRGDDLVSTDLCHEAIRLAAMLTATPVTDTPVTHALLAFLMFQAARLPARTDGAGDVLLLAEQDRDAWDRDLIRAGHGHLEQAMGAGRLSAYHLEAGIAACHVSAATDGDTDWSHILSLYTLLLELRPSPVVALNRAVAVAMVDGPAAGLAAIETIKDDPALAAYPFLPATRGELFLRAGDHTAAAACFRDALSAAQNAAQRRLMMRKLAACDAGMNG